MCLYVSAYRVLILRLYDGETLDEWDQSVLVPACCVCMTASIYSSTFPEDGSTLSMLVTEACSKTPRAGWRLADAR